jgi:hypothetical protein
MRNIAFVDVSFEMLSRMMSLPEGQNVVRAEYSLPDDCIRVLIEGKGLPATPSGCPAMRILPSLREVRRMELDWSESRG